LISKFILLYSQHYDLKMLRMEDMSEPWNARRGSNVLNSIPIKVHRVFLSHNVNRVSSHYLIFHQQMYARQLSNRSILHAGRYLNDKEICYLRTVIVTANVCHSRNELINTGQISALKYKHLELNPVYLLYSRSINTIVIPKLDKLLAKFFTPLYYEQRC
jgi:hypothetical protein